MIVRLDVDGGRAGFYEYRVSHEGETLYDDSGLGSIIDCLVAAVEGLAPDAVGVEVAYRGVISGTYPLAVLGMNVEQVAQHAQNTTAAIEEALGER